LNSSESFSNIKKSGSKQSKFDKFDIYSVGNPDSTSRTTVRGYGDRAFQVIEIFLIYVFINSISIIKVNNILVRQSVILLPTTFLLWNAREEADVSIEALSFLAVLSPTVEVRLRWQQAAII
jgi:hypothetical protein